MNSISPGDRIFSNPYAAEHSTRIPPNHHVFHGIVIPEWVFSE
ncbi:MAG: hypothetical protein RKR03_16245 [Candidatus Competibacter sp.]|nr:hypothetical protein [Candidatus Competibacter sp.]